MIWNGFNNPKFAGSSQRENPLVHWEIQTGNQAPKFRELFKENRIEYWAVEWAESKKTLPPQRVGPIKTKVIITGVKKIKSRVQFFIEKRFFSLVKMAMLKI